ncbi:MAG: carboxylesterase/lipase family protein, partial [Lachnospiraceae bacterium]|nr:carboxylesterase/lipase family protein [Lachnospiraceae bacterium]
MKQFMCNDKTTVSTKAGKLRGYFFDGSYIFKGVHYAEADRFEKPRDVEPWEGVKDATSFGFVCPLMGKETPSGELLVPHAYWPQDEHCQNLNVWTTDLCPEAKKPVMVWLHGGGYSAGSSIEQICYDGANMAKLGDVVVVTLNHRLNIIGYLDLSDFGEEYDNTGNLGHMDMVAALKWVHENIASFGGDPENVTIFGQSGGGMKVT